MRKLIQRQIYSCLSSHYGVWFGFVGLCIIVVSAFHFGEVVFEWSMMNHAGKFKLGRYYDNIASKSFEPRLCLPQPIDIVYTWVNGSDPHLIKQLNAYKEHMEDNKLDYPLEYRKTKCPGRCIQTKMLAISSLPSNITTFQLQLINAMFRDGQNIMTLNNVHLVKFPSIDIVDQLVSKNITYEQVKLNLTQVFYLKYVQNLTNHQIENALLTTKVFSYTTKESTFNQIDQIFPNTVQNVELFQNDGIIVVYFKSKEHARRIKAYCQQNKNFLGTVYPVGLYWNFTSNSDGLSLDGDLTKNRFADNAELKYSIRSVEKFAPWVRKIFIVTNGQIPSWLNLNHPRVMLVTHDEIFTNKSHLPTFSSPAIESHIHRIPGLSKKFIYMNDDVFFGKQVWPDDFFTHSKGQKIFQAWAVPNCHEGCPSSWLNDKYCDKACNYSICDWDGGDCIGVRAQNSLIQSIHGQRFSAYGEYCSNGCAHNWLGDRYCDSNCNTLNCGFDAGDCGTRNFDQIFSHTFKSGDEKSVVHINVPPETFSMFFNLTDLFSELIEGNFEDSVGVLRSSVLGKTNKVLSLTFFRNHSKVTVPFQVLGYKGENKTDKFVLFFNVTVNTKVKPLTKAPVVIKEKDIKKKVVYPVTLYNDNLSPILKPDEPLVLLNSSQSIEFSEHFKEMLIDLENQFKDGEITSYGFNKSKQLLYNEQTKMKKYSSRKLLSTDVYHLDGVGKDVEKTLQDPYTSMFSFLPWERLVKDSKPARLAKQYLTKNRQTRHLLDSFSSSLLYVSHIYNREFGYQTRKVPAHMPHLVDRDIIFEMQDHFRVYFEATSSHKMRHPHDMQFAFSYNYYLISVKKEKNLSVVFDLVDADGSGALSDRELRSLAAFLFPIPMTLNTLQDLEFRIKNCSKRLNNAKEQTNFGKSEIYYDKDLPLVTRKLFLNCHELWKNANFTNEKEKKYPHEILGEDDVTFKMLRNNVTYTLHQLDWIRRNRKKFICLNDNLDHTKASTGTIRTLLKDFYESFFPLPSQFELNAQYRNKFLFKNELNAWLALQHTKTNFKNACVILTIMVLVMLIYRRKVVFLSQKLTRCFHLFGRRTCNV